MKGLFVDGFFAGLVGKVLAELVGNIFASKVFAGVEGPFRHGRSAFG
jgi:hypothetical protein